MKQWIGIFLLLTLPSAALAQTYVGVGAGSVSGDGWSGNAPEVFIGHSLTSGWQVEFGFYDLGSRSSSRQEEATGLLAMELGYSLANEIGYLNFAGGVYAYHSEYHTGDAFYGEVGTAPVLSVSSGYFVSNNLTVRIKYGKYFLENDFGSPSRVSAAVAYSF